MSSTIYIGPKKLGTILMQLDEREIVRQFSDSREFMAVLVSYYANVSELFMV
jgi:hypothetical protein